MNLHDLLNNYADDSELEVNVYNRKNLVLLLTLDVRNGEKYIIDLRNPIHLDMPPYVSLGRIEFGGASLLPENYLEARWRGYFGDEAALNVVKITDDEGNEFFIIYSGEQTWMQVAVPN